MEKQPPSTTAKALNVFPSNVWDRRQTGGSRPGTGKYSYTQLGSGAKVNMLTSVDWASSSGATQIWSDDFNTGPLDETLWTQTDAIATTTLHPSGLYTASGYGGGTVVSAITRGAAFKNLSVNTSSPYTITANIRFYKDRASSVGAVTQSVRIYARMDATTPTPASGMYVELSCYSNGSGVFGSLVVDGVSASTFSVGCNEREGNFSVTINGNTITADWAGNALLGAGVSISSHGSNVRTGFWAQSGGYTIQSSPLSLYNKSTLQVFRYGIGNTSTTNVDVQTAIVAGSNGTLYVDDGQGTFSSVGSAALSTDSYLQAVDYQQKLYIANYSLTDAAKVPKIYDPSAGTVATWTASNGGTLPSRFSLIARYSDRIVVGREFANPHLWYMSRKGDPLDWDYTQLALGDNGSAIAGSNSDASAIGKALTALVPFGDDYMVMGCSDEIWVMRGDPAFGGAIDSLSRKVGIIDKFAWCRTPEGGLLFLSKDGLYYTAPGATMVPESISREKLPAELFNVDTLQVDVCMEFDTEFRGAWIMLHNKQAGQATSWFFDWENKGFWPMQYPLTQEATTVYFTATQNVRGVLLGCSDGYVRRHSTAFRDDDGTALGSYCEIGPIRIGGSGYDEGKLTELVGTPHYRLGTVTWTAKAAKNAQSLYNDVSGAVDSRTGTWGVGLDGSALATKDRQRIRGGAMVLRLEETDGEPWAVENVLAKISVAGKQRVAS